MKINSIKSIYFIGIGGIGMSALARYFLGQGAAVAGYDRTETDLTKKLAAEGCAIHYEDRPDLIPKNVDLVVWTPAVPKDFGELVEIERRGLPLLKRAAVLGLLSKSKKCVAVGGTHGKTTTSSMAAHLFRACGIDATAFLGGIATNLGSNFIEGKSDWVVVEADEYDRSFLQLHPTIAVVNSVDADHLDIYGSADAVVESYAQFARQIQAGGSLLVQMDQPLPLPDHVEIYRFGYEKGSNRRPDVAFLAKNARVEKGWSVFDLRTPFGNFKNLKLRYPGHHNIENATAAIASALLAGAEKGKIRSALAKFSGVKRRFEFWIDAKKAAKKGCPVLVDDYGHHPAELEATIQAARSLFPDKKIAGIFQPHLFSRTQDFADDFGRALSKLDVAILLPIYPAREAPIKGVTSDWLLSKILNVENFSTSKQALFNTLVTLNVDVVLTLGAGDIDLLLPKIKRTLLKKSILKS